MERRTDIVEVLKSRGYSRMWDLSGAEKEGHFFEGTGVLVLDRVNGIAYVNLSERADAGLAQQWADRMGYKVCGPHLFGLYMLHWAVQGPERNVLIRPSVPTQVFCVPFEHSQVSCCPLCVLKGDCMNQQHLTTFDKLLLAAVYMGLHIAQCKWEVLLSSPAWAVSDHPSRQGSTAPSQITESRKRALSKVVWSRSW